MWVEFTKTQDWKPQPQVTIAIAKGQQANWNRDLAHQAIAAGVAKAMTKTGKDKPAVEAK